MKSIRASLCILLTLFATWLPVLGQMPDLAKAEMVRTGMTIAGAGLGLAAGSTIGIGFSLDAIDTPLSNTLLLTIPAAAAGMAAGAVAGRWIANVALNHQPSFLFSIIEGAGLGLVAGAFVGGVTFPVAIALGIPILEVPEGYWGFDYLGAVGMAVLAGALWGGFYGAMAGAVALPVISLVMGF